MADIEPRTKRTIVKKIYESEWEKGEFKKSFMPSGILISFLAEKYANIKQEMVPLNEAVYYGYAGIVEALLELGADPNRNDDLGVNSAYTLANRVNSKGVQKDSDEAILKMLIDHGVNLDNYEIGKKGRTARKLLKHSNLSHLIEDE